MKLAFVFPGQGSQSVGMLDSFEGNAAVEDILARAGEALGEDIAAMIHSGPAEALNLTVNTQPALLTASCAMLAAWRAMEGPEPEVVAGHSLGEYSALVAAGALALEDAVPLVRFRAQAMQEAVPVGEGTMAAIIGLTDDQVREACAAAADGIAEPVNFNSPGQVVIAGHVAAVGQACEAAKAMGAKRAIVLNVSAPFHSSLLRPASERLAARLAEVPVAEPGVDLINNIDVAIEKDPQAIRSALARQAAGAVQWVRTVQKMQEMGVTHIVECGPGRVLSGLIRRIAPSITCIPVGDAQSMAAAVEQLSA